VSSGSFDLSPVAIALYHEARGPVDIGIRDHYFALTPRRDPVSGAITFPPPRHGIRQLVVFVGQGDQIGVRFYIALDPRGVAFQPLDPRFRAGDEAAIAAPAHRIPTKAATMIEVRKITTAPGLTFDLGPRPFYLR
jgi:hypothetical protein